LPLFFRAVLPAPARLRIVVRRAGVYLAATLGVTAQYMYTHLRFDPAHASEWVGDIWPGRPRR